MLGGLLWLSTRARRDLSFSVSSAAQVLIKDIELLKVKLRRLLQYINITQTLGLLYPYPRHREMTDFTVYSDASFAPAGKHSQSGYTIHLCSQLSASCSRILYFLHGHVIAMRHAAAIAMIEEPGWRTRYISTYAEAIRQEMLSNTLTLTNVSTEFQLADPLTKPSSSSINSTIFPQWGLVSFTPN